MIGIILFGFIGCFICGWLIGISDNDDRVIKFLTYFIAIITFSLSIICLITWKEIIQEQVIFEHYNIIQEEVTTTKYKTYLATPENKYSKIYIT